VFYTVIQLEGKLFRCASLNLIRIIPVPIAQQPIAVLDSVDQFAITLHLLQVLALVPNQALVRLVAGSHVNHIPKASPAVEAAAVHVHED